MNEVSNIKSPGWARVVSDLSAAAPDDALFLLRLVSTFGTISGARQAALFLLVPGTGEATGPDVRPAQTWPFAGGLVDAQGRTTLPSGALLDPARFDAAQLERPREATQAARAAAGTRQVQVFAIDEAAAFYGTPESNQQFLVAVPVAGGLPHEAPSVPARAVVTLLVEARSRVALQSVLALLEVLAGYVFTHEAQQQLRRTRQASASLDLAARLIASMNSVEGFKAASMQLVNDLCRMLSVDRVALGWAPGSPQRWGGRRAGVSRERQQTTGVVLRALSDTEHIDRRMEMCRRIEGAMDECLDQEQPLLFPQPAGDAVLGQTIVHAHRELARNDAGLRIASFPLRVVDTRGERIAGVLLLESAGAQRLDPAMIELVQATLDLVAPVLAVRASDDRNLALRTWDSLLRGAAWAVGPRHTVWKAAGILLMIATAVLFLGRTTYRVGAPMEVRPQVSRVVAAPLDGIVASIPAEVREGARVSAGQVLMQMDTQELVARSLEAAASRVRAQTQMDQSLRAGDAGEAAQHRAAMEQAIAQERLYALQIERSTIRSPIDGTIISADVRERLGSTLRLGEEVFEVADLSRMVVKVRVPDRDIAFVRVGQTGEISPKSQPSLTVPIVVERVVPLSQAQDGVNAFEVRCRLEGDAQEWFLPGLEGQAKLNAERRSFAWIISRRVVDQLRVWLWW